MTYVRSKTLQEALKDPVESHLRIVKFVLHRIRLAYVLAVSFLHFVLVGTPLDCHAGLLQYYSDHGSQKQSQGQSQNHPLQDHELAAQRIAPYYQLKAIGSAVHCQSSAGLLITVGEPVGEDQIKVQKLGVLLYEVGMWKTVATNAEDWRSRSAAARSEKSELLKCLPAYCFNAVHACLDWTPQDFEDSDGLANWLNAMVVSPLRQALESLSKEFQLG